MRADIVIGLLQDDDMLLPVAAMDLSEERWPAEDQQHGSPPPSYASKRGPTLVASFGKFSFSVFKIFRFLVFGG